MIRISVKDHGNGINEETIGKIYDPFFTTKGRDKGTGLGLTISYGIIKDHQGSLEVDTQKGRFTTFHIYLPAEKAKSDT